MAQEYIYYYLNLLSIIMKLFIGHKKFRLYLQHNHQNMKLHIYYQILMLDSNIDCTDLQYMTNNLLNRINIMIHYYSIHLDIKLCIKNYKRVIGFNLMLEHMFNIEQMMNMWHTDIRNLNIYFLSMIHSIHLNKSGHNY